MPQWTSAVLALELASPLHLGNRVAGNWKQTRRYVVGRSVWGAIVDRSARAKGAQEPDDFRKAQIAVSESIRFSYAFPSTSCEEVTLWPWQEPAEFDWTYVNSYASTALVDGHSKEDGSLHETEYLAPKTRSGQQVYLLVKLWCQSSPDYAFFDPLTPAFWAGAQIGGEKGYGWGRIRRAHSIPAAADDWMSSAGWTSEPDSGGVIVKRRNPEKEVSALAHVTASSPVNTEWIGNVEPLLGRETHSHRPGLKIACAVPAYQPGSKSCPLTPMAFQITAQGLWTPVPAR